MQRVSVSCKKKKSLKMTTTLHITRSEVVEEINRQSSKISRQPSLKLIEKTEISNSGNDQTKLQKILSSQKQAPLLFFKKPQKFLPVLVMTKEEEQHLFNTSNSSETTTKTETKTFSQLQREKLKDSFKIEGNVDVYVVVNHNEEAVEKAKFTSRHTRSAFDHLREVPRESPSIYNGLFDGQDELEDDLFGLLF
jgi:hypothetical protein